MKKYLITELPNQDGLLQVLAYDKEIKDYRAMAFDVTPQDAKLIVKALNHLEKKTK
jgi:hypothetical protein